MPPRLENGLPSWAALLVFALLVAPLPGDAGALHARQAVQTGPEAARAAEPSDLEHGVPATDNTVFRIGSAERTP